VKGLKIRVQQSDLAVAMLEAMGANATPMPLGEVYTGLKTGLLDAAENNLPSYDSTRAFEAAKYYMSMTEHTMTPEMLLFSKRAVGQAARSRPEDHPRRRTESVPYMRKQWAERELKSKAARRKAGAQSSMSTRPRSRQP
jgi:TRAP-type C4-dicarboxylate transport system substrate-binding protein